MNENKKMLERIFAKEPQSITIKEDDKYKSIKLKFNPFPRSGTANINGSDIYNQKLIPVDDDIKEQIVDFIAHGLSDNYVNTTDKFISATVTGNYGSGKTQLLMFIKYILGEVAALHKGQKNPYVIYIDSPGVKLLEFIGSIISKIGEEDFKKFIWTKIIDQIKNSNEFRSKLLRFEHQSGALFNDINPDPYSDENMISYKKFLDSFVRHLTSTKKRKDFEDSLKEILLKVLEIEANSTVLAQYFYDLISEDFGVNKTWEALSSGNIKQLDRKESEIIKYIVRLIKEQGYTDFFILVDEFEDITEGRLTKAQVDNYVYNLRTLLDEHREWCLLFAMTGQALKKLRSVSPPLADRISARLIILQNLDTDQAAKIVMNYLNTARDEESNEIFPFDITGIQKLNDLTDGNARKFLKNCFFMVEKSLQVLSEGNTIDSKFITKHYSKDKL